MTGECPRCRAESITVLARSAVPDLWDVLACQRCTYIWRTSEPAAQTSAAAYPARGGAGVLSFTANVAPRLCSEMHEACRRAMSQR